MVNPRIEIDLYKLRHNTENIVKLCQSNNISVMGVAKVFCGNYDIAMEMVKGGVKYLSDSRIENIIALKGISIPKVLLRIPMPSEVEQVVEYADYSLNSEIGTIYKISDTCVKQHKTHKIILMFDLGDLREGIWYKDYFNFIEEVRYLPGVEIAGIGTNLTCYGGVIPTNLNLSVLTNIAKEIRQRLNIELPIVSGGNSSSLHLIENKNMPEGINNLRIGEAIALGRETAYGRQIEGLYDDCFMLYGEIIEVKRKPSLPFGQINMDAFGNKPEFTDKGMSKRAIVALGRQDIRHEDLIPCDSSMEILGASSDHLLLDITECKAEYEPGSEVKFKLGYGSLLSSMTSNYVKKVMLNPCNSPNTASL
ncbi:hypothetical protein OXPF_43130 [Oxobacter pfennigii]|uniref:Alanine racemase N-terminal domain-containing protein n=1 Tax=Oxobacter pfennigii TaxID=36849 RepID=A0A0N8NSN5_9CLOT|nr:ornithine racemase Orr [Oxobacter pfennigii]KPU42528.1 hypothetical protein OXPF_43130 [Oxobacter pfennigii]